MKLIQIDEACKKFLLRAGDSSYAFGVNSAGFLSTIHWGGLVERLEDLPSTDEVECYRHLGADRSTLTLQEYPAFGGEFYNEPALKVDLPGGVRCSILKYDRHAVTGDGQLSVFLKDYGYPLEVELRYKVWRNSSLIERSAVITNKGEGVATLKTAMSACLHPPRTGRDARLSHLAGRWGREGMIKRQAVTQGKIVLENRTGLSSTFEHPFFALDEGSATEDAGRVWFGTLLWCGVWKMSVEMNAFEEISVIGGVADFDFSWPLKPGERFETPALLFGVSSEGFGGASRLLHAHQRQHIAPKIEAERTMKVLCNSWGSLGANVNEESILALAEKSAPLGVELFVIDDGWQSSLGDWWADPVKFPKGLKPVVEKVRELGMDFGLWVEVESFETKSELYKKHPEWAMSFAGREPQRKLRADVDRCSMLLNFARQDVADFIFEALEKLVKETGIKYLKLDMNCFVSDPGWNAVPEERRQTIWVEYARNVYDVFAKLKREFPELLIENCASGAGRGDLSMDAVFGRMNRSDNQDTLDVLKLHEGFTWLHPSKMAGGACHISDSMAGINLRRIPLRMQAFAGMLGSLAIGKNLPKCPQAELDEIAGYVKLHKSIRPVVQQGQLYRLVSIYDNPYCAFEYVSQDKSEAVLFVFGQSSQFSFKVPPLKLKGLDSGRLYDVLRYSPDHHAEGQSAAPESKSPVSGQGLMELGVRVEVLGDYDAHIVHLKAKG